MKQHVYLFICLLFPLCCFSQAPEENPPEQHSFLKSDSSRKVLIASIHITGNRQTRKYIIEREMLFKVGDSIEAGKIFEYLDESKKLIYNTALFTSVTVEPASLVTGNEINIAVHVKEKWYLYPTPQFQLVDRNINEWIKTYHADLNRVVYGIKFAHYNFSGRRDQLRIYLLNGYSRNISFTYSSPYSNPSLTEGFSIGVGYTQNREVAYKTSTDNKLLQFNNGDFVRKSFAATASYSIRKGYYKRHTFSVAYSYFNVIDSVITERYNAHYFNSENNVQHIPDFFYTFSYIKTDNVLYPLEGKIYAFGFSKRGLAFNGGINALTLDIQFNKYFSHGKKWYSYISSGAKIRLPFDMAYINQRAFGFSEYNLRGLENYVIDGVASAMVKYTLKRKVADFTIKTPFKKSKVIPDIPFKLFAKTYTDCGVSYLKRDEAARLNNIFLYTGGFGLDIVTLFDINLKLEYSFNQLRQNGLFLQTKGGF